MFASLDSIVHPLRSRSAPSKRFHIIPFPITDFLDRRRAHDASRDLFEKRVFSGIVISDRERGRVERNNIRSRFVVRARVYHYHTIVLGVVTYHTFDYP